MRRSDAQTVADVLVWADERGVQSHGVMRIPTYLAEIRKANTGLACRRLCDSFCRATFNVELQSRTWSGVHAARRCEFH
jgi:Malate/L-lactate dehydrogenase